MGTDHSCSDIGHAEIKIESAKLKRFNQKPGAIISGFRDYSYLNKDKGAYEFFHAFNPKVGN